MLGRRGQCIDNSFPNPRIAVHRQHQIFHSQLPSVGTNPTHFENVIYQFAASCCCDQIVRHSLSNLKSLKSRRLHGFICCLCLTLRPLLQILLKLSFSMVIPPSICMMNPAWSMKRTMNLQRSAQCTIGHSLHIPAEWDVGCFRFGLPAGVEVTDQIDAREGLWRFKALSMAWMHYICVLGLRNHRWIRAYFAWNETKA